MSWLRLFSYACLVILSSQGLMLILLLFRKKKQPTHVYLLISFITIAMSVVFLIVIQRQTLVNLPTFFLLHQPLIYLLLPLFYLYTLSLTTSNFHFKKVHTFHFVLPSFVGINLLPYYFSTANLKTVSLTSPNQLFEISWWWYLLILCVSGWLYLLGSVYQLKDFLGTFSLLRNKVDSKNWLRIATTLLVFLLISASIRLISNYWLDTELISLLLLASIVIIIGLGHWKYIPIDSLKYAGSSLSGELSKKYLSLLESSVACKELYRNEKLTVHDLSNELNIPTHHISQVINQELNVSFWDFINTYRINEAKRLLLSSENPKILRVAYESGFNSRSAFYTAFKKHTGSTPSQFRKNKKMS